MKSRLAFLVKPKKELLDHLESIGSDLDSYFMENYVITTQELNYDEDIEGWTSKIKDLCKVHFVKDSIFEVISDSNDTLNELFGTFQSEIELFDRWWYFESADCSEIATTWKQM